MFSVSSAGHCPLLSRRSIVTLVSALLVIPAWVVPCVAGDRGSDKIAVKLVLDYSKAPEAKPWAEKSAALVKEWYPKVAEMLASEGFSPPREMKLVFQPGGGVASTTGDTIHVSADWIKKHPDDFGLVIHEMTHVIQHYPNPDPSWVTEGIADYVRWFNFEPEGRRPRPNPQRTKYTDSYQTTAAFFAWIVKNHDKDFVKKLNAVMRQSKYSSNLFKESTGKTVDELWQEYIAACRLTGPVLAAAKPLVVELWPGKVPDETGNLGAEKFLMSPKMDRKQVEVTQPTRLVTNVSKPTITIYRPAKDKDTGTAVLICPGGGYWDLYWQLEGEEVAAWLNSLGATGIILKYRVPRRPDEPKGEPAQRPLQDAQRAMSLVRSHAGQWGIDPQRIGIVGFSAGGHLALATATGFEKRTYEPIDDSDKASCRPDFAILCYSGYLKAKDKDELASSLHIPAGTPPVFLVHGGDDIISSPAHSVVAYLALKRAGIPAELHVYATAAHDFGVRPSEHPCSTWTQSCAQWLQQQGLLALRRSE